MVSRIEEKANGEIVFEKDYNGGTMVVSLDREELEEIARFHKLLHKRARREQLRGRAEQLGGAANSGSPEE